MHLEKCTQTVNVESLNLLFYKIFYLVKHDADNQGFRNARSATSEKTFQNL